MNLLTRFSVFALANLAFWGHANSCSAALIGHWVADDWSGSGNWNDRVGNYVAAINGNPTVSTNAFGSTGTVNGINLDGNDFFNVTAANNPAVGKTNFTVIALFKTTTGGANNNTGGNWWQNSGIVGGEVSANPNDWGLMLLQDGRANGAFRSASIQSPGSVIDGTPHTLAVTWSDTPGDTFGRVYLDGTLIGTTTAQDGGVGIANAGFAIGKNFATGTAFYTGDIGVVQLYDSIEDIGSLHATLTTPIPEPTSLAMLATSGLFIALIMRRRWKTTRAPCCC